MADAPVLDGEPAEVFRVNLRVCDRHGRVIQQTLDLGHVDHPARGVLRHR